jgi:hypothetical protein
MGGVFEGSFSASVRVDARNLAVVARWMLDNNQDVTRSSVLGQSLKIIANSVLGQRPELQVDTLEQAYTNLFNMGMAPKSTRGLLTMAQSLRTEQMAQVGNMEGIVKQLRNMAHGEGLAKLEAEDAVANEILNINTQRQATEAAQKYNISDEDREMLNMAITSWRKQGLDQVEIDEKTEVLVTTFKKVDMTQEDEVLAKQKIGIGNYTDQLKQQASIQSQTQELTQEQRIQNFETSVVKNLIDVWESDLQAKYVDQTRPHYMRVFSEDNEEHYQKWLEELVEVARPGIDKREEDNKAMYEQQERERAARKQAKAAKQL